MAKAEINKTFVEGAAPGRYYDSRLDGFVVDVGVRGASYLVQYRTAGGRDGKVQRYVFARHGHPHPEGGIWTAERARTAALVLLGGVKAGDNPMAKRKAEHEAAVAAAEAAEAAKRTTAHVIEDWLRHDQASNRTYKEVCRIMETIVVPAIGHMPMGEVRRRDINAFIRDVALRAPGRARNVLTSVKRLFRWAASQDEIEYDIARDIEKGAAEFRDRVLDDDELKMIWLATQDMSGAYRDLLRVLLLTGARVDEIRKATWDEVVWDGDDPVALRLAPARVKAKVPRTIWLTGEAAEIVKQRPKWVNGAGYVFSVDGKCPYGPMSRSKLDLDKRIAGLNGGTPIEGWWVHDLRRGIATGLQRLGERLEVIEAVLGHVTGSRAGIVGVYQRHRYEDEARAALQRWATHLNAVIHDRETNVVRLQRRR